MNARKRKNRLAALAAVLTGLAVMAVLGAAFYGTMVYQMLPREGQETPLPAPGAGTPAPLAAGVDAAQAFPGPLLALTQGELISRAAEDVHAGGENCRVVRAVYETPAGRAEAVSAWPAAYLSRLADEGWTPQLIAGCELAQMEAVYEERGAQGLLAAQEGERVYLLIGPADEQQMYALGAACVLE